MNKLLLSFFFLTILFAPNIKAQTPNISYQSPQTLYIGKQTAPITVKNTGGTVPAKFYPQQIPLTPDISLFGATDFVMNSAGDFFVIVYSQIIRYHPDGTYATFAGNPNWGTMDGTGTSAGFQEMDGIAKDASDNLYVTEQDPYDGANCKIRKITPAGVVTTYATGLPSPYKITVANNGIIYVSTYQNKILKIDKDGSSSLLAGQNTGGSTDGVGANASFSNPSALTTDQAGNIYVDDFNSSRFRKITPDGTVTTFAGSSYGSADGIGTAAQFFNPTDIAFDSKQNLIVADGNGLVRKITPSGAVTTIAQPPYFDGQNNPIYQNYPTILLLDKNDNIISHTQNNFYKLSTTGFSISPALPAGLTFATDGSINGTPTVLSDLQTYTVRAQNSTGVSSTTINLKVVIPSDPPVIDSISPISAPTGGLVYIYGKYFTGATAVTIGGKPASEFDILSPTSITAYVGTGAGSGDVTVTNLHGTAKLSGFKFIPPPVITSFSPTSGGNGSVITITGTGFTNVTGVSVGGYYATFNVISPTKIQATLGSGGGTGSISVNSTNGSADLAGFTYLVPPSVSSVSPASGGPGTTVTITGSNFSNATAVKFGTVPASSFTVVSASQITAKVASGSSDGVTVTTPGGSINYSYFTYIPAPAIIQVSPLTGGNGSAIYINGANLSGATVTIGGVPAASVYAYSSSQLVATVGSGASGDIVVVTPSGTAKFPGFVWVPAPVITSFSPKTAGLGDKVTITGTNFTGAINVAFGGVAAKFNVLSPTSIEATVGTGASGPVTVATAGGLAGLDGFVDSGPAITSFSPTQAGAGSTVTITGSNFNGVTQVNFGGVPATSFKIVSSTQITAVVGQGKSGDVTVVSPQGTGDLAGFVHPGPSISYFSPGYSGAFSTTLIQIIGTNFTGATSVTFGGKPAASFTVVSSGYITATPANASSGDVVVTTPLGSDKKSGFVWVSAPTISSISPSSQKSNNPVTITGTNFTGLTGVSFGGVPALSFFANSPTSITAYVGSGASGDVTVSTVGGSASIGGFIYASPTITSISPTAAIAGQTVTITGTNLNGITAVQFGGIAAASFSVVSSEKITAVAGSSGGSGNVYISGPSGSATIAGFTFIAAPVVSSFTPDQGGAGTIISIYGSNLATVKNITIGGVPAVIGKVADNVVQATVGSGASGKVSVTTLAGTAQSDGFTWLPPPTITSVDPLTAGAPTIVTLTGTNFTGVTQVTFGSIAVGFTIVSPTQITVQPIYAASGDIVVTNIGGTAIFHGFVFVPAPVISGFSSSGDGQNAVVTISGSGFNNASAVQFGGVDAQSFTVVSSTQITAKTAAGATGAITVTTPGGTGSLDGFLYQKPPSIISFSPAKGPIGTTVVINGDNFSTTAANNIVFIGPVKADVTKASKTQLQVTAPSGATGPITISNIDNSLSASSNLPFFITNTNSFNGFSNKLSIPLTSINSYEISDFDGDGQPDLLIAKEDSVFILRHGTDPVLSKTSFSQKIVLSSGRTSSHMVIGDLDGDGKNDILYNINRSVVILHNTSTKGNISFDQKVIENIGNDFLEKMVLRDIDMDGKPDLVFSSGFAYRNTSSGSTISFGTPVSWGNIYSSSNISSALADIDGDNKPDPVLGSSYTGFSIAQNNSVPGSFNQQLFPLTYILHSGYYYTPYTLITADVDGDGKPDIIENDFSESQFLVSRNLAVKGTISTSSVGQPSAFANGSFWDGMQAADVDGDGKVDLIGISYSNVSWSMNTSSTGNISFNGSTPLLPISSAIGIPLIGVADMDGDGRPDVVAFDYNTRNLTIYNNGPVVTPKITGVTPLKAGTGTTITITGKYLGATTSVNFGSKPASTFKVIAADTVTAVVGPGESGNITLATGDGPASFPGFIFIPAPVLTSATPAKDGSGKLLISGNFLSTATTISIAGITASSFTVNSDTSITAIFSDASGVLSVKTIGGTATLQGIAIISSVPAITSVSAKAAIAGSSITITGTNFSGATSVTFGGIPATSFTVNSSTSITATVGNAKSGDVNVITPIGTGTFSGFIYVPVPTITAGGPTTILSNGTGVILAASPGSGYSYQWVNNGVNISSATNATYSALQAGSYTVIISSNGVSQSSAATTVTSVFNLPPSNFKLTITSETCNGSADGFINIKAAQALNYSALITGNGLNKSYAFTDSTTINNLPAGTYSVCISVTGQANYNNCYSVTLTQPQPLSVYTIVNSAAKSVDLSLTGGSVYFIELNGKQYNTSNSSISLPLRVGNNNLKVTTDKPCQGVFEKLINAAGTIAVYPVPFQDKLYIDIGNTTASKVSVTIFDTGIGKSVYTSSYLNKSGVLELDLTNLRSGVYGLYVTVDGSESIFKIVKQ